MTAMGCQPVPANDAGSASRGTAYELTEHACRYCLGRVVRSGDLFRCASCKAQTMGAAAGICGCGTPVPKWFKSARMTCAPNPTPSPASPSEIVIQVTDKSLAA